MTSLYTINLDGAHDGQQWSLEDVQFDLENVLTMPQLVGKSAEERNAASVMQDILAGNTNTTASEVAGEVVTEAPSISGPRVLYAVLAANTAGRAKVILVKTRQRMVNGLGPGCARGLVWTRERRVSQKCFNTVGRTRSRSKTCGASGARRSPSFHKGH